ncbi:serine hydrolase [Peribacillus cavernae]|uniref:Serine hydrolase n=1 Tax=Peribacillus cavernae TaxID=1674310 RepID=A0A3S0TYA1_9BACI|nr:serine hydrolase [Peribacillus cavernae]MDQ0217364.1 beta-lactamase class A [Peribacillus cavernae]RUQ30186.1 serine hydrolase [Peribacillus cavernae]
MKWIALNDSIKQLLEPFDGRIAFKIEMDDQMIEQKSEDIFPSASLIKIPILIETFRQSEERQIYLNQPVTIPLQERVGGSGVIHAMSDKVFMTIEDILTLMIVVSDNTATNLLISLLGQDQINGCLKELGMDKTVLNRKMMDSKAIEEGRDNYTTAADVLASLKAINEGTLLTAESKQRILTIMKKQQFTDKLPARMDLEKVSVANKTGSLPGVTHDCAIITYGEKTAYAAVLTDGLSSEEEGRQMIAKIGELVYEYITEQQNR